MQRFRVTALVAFNVAGDVAVAGATATAASSAMQRCTYIHIYARPVHTPLYKPIQYSIVYSLAHGVMYDYGRQWLLVLCLCSSYTGRCISLRLLLPQFTPFGCFITWLPQPH